MQSRATVRSAHGRRFRAQPQQYWKWGDLSVGVLVVTRGCPPTSTRPAHSCMDRCLSMEVQQRCCIRLRLNKSRYDLLRCVRCNRQMKRTVAPTVNAAQGRRGCRAATQHVDSVWHRRRPVLECDVHSSVVILILHHQRAAIASKQAGRLAARAHELAQERALVQEGNSFMDRFGQSLN